MSHVGCFLPKLLNGFILDTVGELNNVLNMSCNMLLCELCSECSSNFANHRW
jgi:hypothetical protein